MQIASSVPPSSAASSGVVDVHPAVFTNETPRLSTTILGAIWAFNAGSQTLVFAACGVSFLFTPLKWAAALVFVVAIWEALQLYSGIALMQRKFWSLNVVRAALALRLILATVALPIQAYTTYGAFEAVGSSDLKMMMVALFGLLGLMGLIFFVLQALAFFHLGKDDVRAEFIN